MYTFGPKILSYPMQRDYKDFINFLIINRKNKYEYKVLIDLSCVAVVQNKSNT